MWSNTARRAKVVAVATGMACVSLIGAQANAAPGGTSQEPGGKGQPQLPLNADDLLVSRLVYVGVPGLLTPGQTVLPPGCRADAPPRSTTVRIRRCSTTASSTAASG